MSTQFYTNLSVASDPTITHSIRPRFPINRHGIVEVLNDTLIAWGGVRDASEPESEFGTYFWSLKLNNNDNEFSSDQRQVEDLRHRIRLLPTRGDIHVNGILGAASTVCDGVLYILGGNKWSPNEGNVKKIDYVFTLSSDGLFKRFLPKG